MGEQIFDGLGGGIFALRRPRPYRRTYAPIAGHRFSIAAPRFESRGAHQSQRPFPAEPPPYGFDGVAVPPTTVKGGLLASAPGFANTTGRVL